MEMIADTIKHGKEAIVLIPEIALTFQTVMRFYKRFGEIVSFVNSRMSDSERQDQMDRAISGDCKIMIGPRSALFTPFKNLGLIIVDEEHETSYKSESAPRYHAVRTAIERAKICKADIVLGSATPSVESFYNAEIGNYIKLELPERANDAELPEAEIIDLRQELRSGNKSMFSRKLTELIKDRLDNGEQSMVFLNRRGMMGSVSCRMCGKVIKCPHCEVPLSLHRDGLLHCHYCGTKINRPKKCPKCGSTMIGTMKAGTELVEEKLQKLFPQARILRMDADTTKEKNAHEAILTAFANHEADILVGTQMIVKGHDFSNVTLMGVLVADMSLNASDFRASERTFDLLVQAAGRAGRGERAGTVVIQTYQPDHFVMTSSAEQKYEDFYKNEVLYRKLGKYPPFGHLLKVLIESKNENRIEEFSQALATEVRTVASKKEGFEQTSILGPEDDYPAKINDVYRKTIYLKDTQYDRLIAMKKLISDLFSSIPGNGSVNIWFDYDPL
jgi:primosomal protein N' (replication factor Y)